MAKGYKELVIKLLKKLPSSWRESIFRKSFVIADDGAGFELGQLTMVGSLQNMKRAGFSPKTILDVGANVGEWTRVASQIFSDTQFELFEAQPALEKELKRVCQDLSGRANYRIALLGSEQKTDVTFHTLGTGSSVFEEVTVLEKGQISLPMTKLDDCLAVDQLKTPIMIKLDVQGFELEILKGAPKVFLIAEVVLMEVSLLQYNEGAPLMPEVIEFMRRHDYTPYDICGQHRRDSDRALFQIDMIFVRTQSALRTHRRFSMFEPV